MMNKKLLGILTLTLLLNGCSSLSSREKEFLQKTPSADKSALFKAEDDVVLDREDLKDTSHFNIYDPLEPLNRRIYYFNYYADTYVLQPVTNTYRFVTPKIVRTGVKNFFANFQDVYTLLNSILQLKVEKSMLTLARVSVNSTVGLAGLIDVATMLDFPKTYEDFGLTLAHYGIGKGPYLVLPLLGPSNLRDTTGLVVGSVGMAKLDIYHPIDLDIYTPEITTLRGVNTRNEVNFKYYDSGSPFEYEYIRFFYSKYRDVLQGKHNQ